MGETYANSLPRPAVRALAYRTHRFAILAMSLSSLFDISHPSDFLRSALNMLTEYEQAKEDNDRPKIVWLPTLIFFAWPLIAVTPPMLLLSVSGNGYQNGKQGWVTSPWACQTPPTHISLCHTW